MKKLLFLILLFFVFYSNSQTKKSGKTILVKDCSQENLEKFIGKRIVLIGNTGNAKLGALLHLKRCGIIYIADFESWPEDYFYWDKFGKEKFKTVKVTGTLIERYDLPVFEYSNEIKQGIPFPKGTDLKKASHRFLLKNVTWKILKN